MILGAGKLYGIKVDVRFYKFISCKMEISWLHENQTLKWLWRKIKWLQNWIAKFHGYTKSKSQIACSEWQKSEIKEKLKEHINLNLLKWLKKLYESHFVERKNFIIEYRVKHCFRNSQLKVLQNINASRLIGKFLRKNDLEK